MVRFGGMKRMALIESVQRFGVVKKRKIYTQKSGKQYAVSYNCGMSR